MSTPDPGPRPAAVTEAERHARAGLVRIVEPPHAALSALVERVGAVAAWDAVRAGDAPSGCRKAVAARTADRTPDELHDLAGADLAQAAQWGARLVCPGEDGWPEAGFAAMTAERSGLAAPLALYVLGPGVLPEPRDAVTVVGSRASTEYGRRCAADLAAGAAAEGVAVVSGAAFGIDAAAHRGALHAHRGAGPATVAVLACGIDVPYPAAHQDLLRDIASRGLVVSEYPPGTTPARHRFLTRNRLIAGLSAVTVVVEAGRRSGTVSTANAAFALDRVVMAVPGPITSAMSVGCHDLLREPGVLPATGADDVLEVLGHGTRPPAPPPDRPTDGLSRSVAAVHEALPGRGSRTVRELAESSGVPAVDVMAALAELDLLGLARADSGTWRRT